MALTDYVSMQSPLSQQLSTSNHTEYQMRIPVLRDYWKMLSREVQIAILDELGILNKSKLIECKLT